jgi:protein-S-isoprenylcysteine O-methyltransferase Ste14
MITETKERKSRRIRLVRGIRNLLGVGMYLLLIGLFLEGLAVVLRHWLSFPILPTIEIQLLLTVACLAACLLSAIWFHHSLNLIRVHLLDGENQLVTCGPFAYVRHPLYATLVMTLPPLVIVWLSDLLFFVPWVLILIIAHAVVRLEERELIEAFGTDYVRYRRFVPALLPYKGAGGRRYRGDSS